MFVHLLCIAYISTFTLSFAHNVCMSVHGMQGKPGKKATSTCYFKCDKVWLCTIHEYGEFLVAE